MPYICLYTVDVRTLIKNVPVSEQIASSLRESIADGTLPVGSRLPTENELAERFGVSRNSVREATRALVHSGLLTARAGDGTYVQSDSELGPALFRRAERGRSNDVVEARSLLETFGASAAATRATEGDIAAMRAALERRNNATDAAGHVAADLDFHRAVVAASGNALISELYDSLHEIEAHLMFVTPTTGDFAAFMRRIKPLNDAHEHLLDAIVARDDLAAERIASDLVAEAHRLPAAGRDA